MRQFEAHATCFFPIPHELTVAERRKCAETLRCSPSKRPPTGSTSSSSTSSSSGFASPTAAPPGWQRPCEPRELTNPR
ncbi:hypothetical protein DIPPA_17924 [Diplonema papillatum]|nr:hypothetical protein DIPPA_17924 [Diplonema papillatum]